MYLWHEVGDTIESLRQWLRDAKQERDEARRWSAAWKRAAKANKARHLHDVIKYKLKYRAAVKERDEARAQLANAAASEVDAVQRAQAAGRERELREARARNEALEELVGRIPNVVSYVTATLASATDDPGAEWGQVHRGRAGSSINQLKELARRAYWLLEEDGND